MHAVHLDDAEIALLAERGASIAHCPASNLKLGSGIAPMARAVEAGVNLALGTDGAASNNRLDLIAELRLAALTLGRDDHPAGHGARRGGPELLAPEVQAGVDARRGPGAGQDPVVVDVQHLGQHAGQREPPGERRAVPPVGFRRVVSPGQRGFGLELCAIGPCEGGRVSNGARSPRA